MLYNMIAMLPPNDRPPVNELEKEEPERKDFLEDVDEDRYMSEAWAYVRTVAYKVEEAVAKYVSNIQSRRSMT